MANYKLKRRQEQSPSAHRPNDWKNQGYKSKICCHTLKEIHHVLDKEWNAQQELVARKHYTPFHLVQGTRGERSGLSSLRKMQKQNDANGVRRRVSLQNKLAIEIRYS